ncbi:replication initiator, partial [Streptomyces roseolus]|uniref:replication initiator n=1 Tax=Streptomyces roseolus TaxID=67358 RepID=UPI003667BCAA
RETLGLRGRRVLVSRKWTGKDLPDHKADRQEFVRQMLEGVGITRARAQGHTVTKVEPGDPNCPPREHLVMKLASQELARRAEYDRARLAAAQESSIPGEIVVPQQYSATADPDQG